MASTAIILADSIVATLNSTALSLPFVAERWYVPIRDYTQDLTTLTVSVVPVTIDGQLLNRAFQYMEQYGISLGIQQSIGQGAMTNTQIIAITDPLMAFVEEVTVLLVGSIVATEPYARCIGYKNDPIYVPQHLDEKRIFTSILNLSIKLGR